ncbi:PBS lyase [Pseudomonas purpurea]|uniref:HEAT repeat domain-containing protein n=1 Tax=Pseudomonas purpurea TaxID=3136737 RepID=UPI00326601D1
MKYMKELERLQSGPYPLTDYEIGQLERLGASLHSSGDCSGWVVLSRFGNGFVREIAVRALSVCASVDALVALLERLNDWVPQVRQQAAISLESYLMPERVGLLLQVLAPLMSLAHKQRADHGVMLARVRDVMKAPQAHGEVVKAFVASQGKVARFLFRLLLEGVADPVELLTVALTHREMTVRQMAVDGCAALPVEKAVALLELAFEAPGSSVRVKALRALLTRVEDPREHVRVALLDVSAAMRCLARWAAPRWQLDCRSVLLARLTEPLPSTKREWLGVIGLAKELNEPQADALLRQALETPLVNVRIPALEALGERGLMQQINALDDPSDKVFRCAVVLLRQQPWASVDESLEDAMA